MLFSNTQLKNCFVLRCCNFFVLCAFILGMGLFPSHVNAQMLFNLPAPGTMVTTSPMYTPAIVAGMTIYPDNPLQFDFIIDSGDDNLQGEALRTESKKLINYFLATLTVPEDEMWVNLSPYEENRIIANGLGQTEMGRDMLAQDYLLKQLTASLMYPEDKIGNEFWGKIHAKAQTQLGAETIPTNVFNKVWIVPQKAVVYVNGTNVFVSESYLKVFLEEDYLAMDINQESSKHGLGDVTQQDLTSMSEQTKEVIRSVILPEIEKEVNTGKNFAPLRQIYNSMILATWYKKNLKQSVLGSVYMDRNKTQGIDLEDKQIKDKIYERYVEAFKVGVYDYIKEDYDSATQQMIPKKYFSGGIKGLIKGVDAAMLVDGKSVPLAIIKRLTDPQKAIFIEQTQLEFNGDAAIQLNDHAMITNSTKYKKALKKAKKIHNKKSKETLTDKEVILIASALAENPEAFMTYPIVKRIVDMTKERPQVVPIQSLKAIQHLITFVKKVASNTMEEDRVARAVYDETQEYIRKVERAIKGFYDNAMLTYSKDTLNEKLAEIDSAIAQLTETIEESSDENQTILLRKLIVAKENERLQVLKSLQTGLSYQEALDEIDSLISRGQEQRILLELIMPLIKELETDEDVEIPVAAAAAIAREAKKDLTLVPLKQLNALYRRLVTFKASLGDGYDIGVDYDEYTQATEAIGLIIAVNQEIRLLDENTDAIRSVKLLSAENYEPNEDAFVTQVGVVERLQRDEIINDLIDEITIETLAKAQDKMQSLGNIVKEKIEEEKKFKSLLTVAIFSALANQMEVDLKVMNYAIKKLTDQAMISQKSEKTLKAEIERLQNRKWALIKKKPYKRNHKKTPAILAIEQQIVVLEKQLADKAMLNIEQAAVNGGIDFNPNAMELGEQGEAVNFSVENTLLETLSPNAVEGITPVIINITPITNFMPLFGMVETEQDVQVVLR